MAQGSRRGRPKGGVVPARGQVPRHRTPKPIPWLDGLGWSHFAEAVGRRLRLLGYADSSIALYKRMLCAYGRWSVRAPPEVTRRDLRAYLRRLSDAHVSAHWMAQHICLFRLAWDRLQGAGLTVRWRGPCRRVRMPDILSVAEVKRCLAATRTWTERVALGLTYGACLRPEELRRLRWADVDLTRGEIALAGVGRRSSRWTPLPKRLARLVEFEHAFQPLGLVLPSRNGGRSLSRRGVSAMFSRIGRRAGLDKPLTPGRLRDSSAVHALDAGRGLRAVCFAMGYSRVDSGHRLAMAMRPVRGR